MVVYFVSCALTGGMTNDFNCDILFANGVGVAGHQKHRALELLVAQRRALVLGEVALDVMRQLGERVGGHGVPDVQLAALVAGSFIGSLGLASTAQAAPIGT